MILNENQMEIKENTYFLSEASLEQSLSMKDLARMVKKKHGIDLYEDLDKKITKKDLWIGMATGGLLGGAFAALGATLGALGVTVASQLILHLVKSKDFSDSDLQKAIAAAKSASEEIKSKAAQEKDPKKAKKLRKSALSIDAQVKRIENIDFRKYISDKFKKKKKEEDDK
jgi:hypothetical protein